MHQLTNPCHPAHATPATMPVECVVSIREEFLRLGFERADRAPWVMDDFRMRRASTGLLSLAPCVCALIAHFCNCKKKSWGGHPVRTMHARRAHMESIRRELGSPKVKRPKVKCLCFEQESLPAHKNPCCIHVLVPSAEVSSYNIFAKHRRGGLVFSALSLVWQLMTLSDGHMHKSALPLTTWPSWSLVLRVVWARG